MKIVGKPYTKIDGMAIATGKPVYTEDLAPKDALCIKILRSPHAYARIKSIDISKAETVEGVECILTYKDVPKTRFTLAGQTYPEPSPYDRLILDEIMRYIGDEVAIIAAVNEKTALKAMKLIKVEYEIFEPVLDFEKAIDNPTVIHREDDLHCNIDIGMQQERNIVCTHNVEFGNVEEEIKKCPVVIERTYYTQAQVHAMMETYRAFSYIDHTGRLVVVSSTQIPFHVRRQLSRALGISASKIRVIKPRLGGGFGGKQTGAVEIFTAIVTWKTGKPSMIVYDRKETFTCTTGRHAMRLKVRLGADEEGLIKVVDIEGLSDTGAYGEHACTTFWVVGEKTLPLYNKATALRFSGNVVYTNKVTAGAFRGYGATQGTFALESTINELAVKLNMDPTEIRMKNLMRQGERSIAFGGETFYSSTLDKCIEKGKEMIHWNEKYPSKEIDFNKVRGVGMAITMQGSGIANIDAASAEIRVNEDGSYTLLLGSADMGTGSDTILSQMACEVLNTSMENITVIAADTDVSPYDPGSYASSTTYVTGMAVVRAAEELLIKIKEAAARILKVPKENVDFDGEAIIVNNKEELTLRELAQRVIVGPNSKQLTGMGTYGSEISPPPFVAGFAEVEVDKETGKAELIDYVAVVDCGTVINPNLARIQTEGGIVQGIGLAMYEDIKYNYKGKMATDSFMQYKIPCRKDINSIRVEFQESYEPTGPFGAKSIGEVVINTPAPAIAAAIYNAVGVNIRTLPITPEKVFMAMHNK
ncbi:CO/xanthine dehydrogenase Mo-binding subunit [Clostridium tetanomorphum]|uniref:Molybdopterin-dependent oxidoreductase n=2 Tax=Clostridium TaxID=1485 RepID=A0A923E8P1_CLOTT|nr:molybdopterin cofactor-binding domain-containing protein [Clostridium tetanomorphum]KAJ51899.1 molybdopterin binding aldehyde oxidase and xanthine dehydrogenase [Clostridium tetanomorphum DSM 665]MBC2398627.1 molybdopterin-dependent oxidoreductase [Clostridium tetanomorphum]MBP1864096.1 CO/xanthine dehydrogenase Mo-binding subunit [Clostridium tetanomorphum]NRS84509.1 CO/xanthine dehydrogenase Mo-binding subunit [Clostridium tetanomorphum]NRZ97723.1 CO/xanthine dehydrogenase Mo-binding subu